MNYTLKRGLEITWQACIGTSRLQMHSWVGRLLNIYRSVRKTIFVRTVKKRTRKIVAPPRGVSNRNEQNRNKCSNWSWKHPFIFLSAFIYLFSWSMYQSIYLSLSVCVALGSASPSVLLCLLFLLTKSTCTFFNCHHVIAFSSVATCRKSLTSGAIWSFNGWFNPSLDRWKPRILGCWIHKKSTRARLQRRWPFDLPSFRWVHMPRSLCVELMKSCSRWCAILWIFLIGNCRELDHVLIFSGRLGCLGVAKPCTNCRIAAITQWCHGCRGRPNKSQSQGLKHWIDINVLYTFIYMCGKGLPVPLQGTRGGTSQDMTW